MLCLSFHLAAASQKKTTGKVSMLCQKQKPQRFESEESCFCTLIRRFNVGHLWSSASDYRRNQIKQEVTITPPNDRRIYSMKFWYHYHEKRRRVGWRERRAGGSHSVPVARSQFTKCINHFIRRPSSPPIWGFRALAWRTPPQFVAQIWEKKAISAIGLRNYINRISKDFSLCLMDKRSETCLSPWFLLYCLELLEET